LLYVSLAGPASNLLLALIFGIGCRILGITSFHSIGYGFMGIIKFMIAFAMIINIVLAVFNILPIPPLDGSKILMGLVPRKYERQFVPYLRYGPTLLIGLIAIGYLTNVSILWAILNPFVKFFTYLFAGSDMTF